MTGQIPQPYHKKERYQCPFYGFDGTNKRVYLDSEGNQCGLKTLSYAPCQMEIDGDTPDWGKCPHNTEENRKGLTKILDKVRLFPKEFYPPRTKSWGGITLRQWIQYLDSIAK